MNKHNALLSSAVPLFDAIARLKTSSEESVSQEDWGALLKQRLHEFERQAFEAQLSPNHVTEAKYALVALIDETVLRSKWPGKTEWMTQMLQVQVFGEHMAGQNFFNRLTQLRQGGDLNLDVLEVFYIALCMGFEGKYSMEGKEKLLSLQLDLKNQIDLYRGTQDPRLSPDAQHHVTALETKQKRWPSWTAAACCAALVCLTYLGYGIAFKLLSDHHKDEVRATLEKSYS